jgi:hypothetical protein
MTDHLERLARRAEQDPFFLAAALHAYARSSDADDRALAAQLGCPTGALTRLRLCRTPAPAAPAFWQDVERIAARFGIDPHTLAEVVRRGQSLVQLRSAEACGGPPAFLLAAREGPDPSPPAGGPG